MTTISFSWGFGLFVAYVILVIVSLRLSRREPAVVVIMAGAGVFVAGLAIIVASGSDANFWYLSVVYGFLVLTFLMCFGAVYKSLSLRMLLDLMEAPGRVLAERQLSERYIKEKSFKDRIGVMIDKGLASEDGGLISLTAKGERIAQATRRLQRFYRIEKSG